MNLVRIYSDHIYLCAMIRIWKLALDDLHRAPGEYREIIDEEIEGIEQDLAVSGFCN